MPTVQDAMPSGTSMELQLEKMKKLLAKRLVSGCDCGCRGDWEIKDAGLDLIGEHRTVRRTGAGSDWDDMRKGHRQIDAPPSAVDEIIDMILERDRQRKQL